MKNLNMYFLTTLGALSGAAGLQAQEKPNIVCILADDIGYTDWSCYGAERIHTPALDQLASEGVRFTQAHSPASTSSPSRYALLTGEYAWRNHVEILPADAPLTIDPEKNTLPLTMKRLGYQTGHVGKWHLGLGSKEHPVDFNERIVDGPLAIGFDYTYFFPATNDRVPCVFVENERVVNLQEDDPIGVSYYHALEGYPTGKEHPELLTLRGFPGHDKTIVNGIARIGWMSGGRAALWDDETMGDVLLAKAQEFVRNRDKERPFFLYYAAHNAHEPRVPSPAFRGHSEAGVYGDVIEQFDDCVGQLVQTLKDEGIYENTIIIVTSDNGPMVKEGYDDGAEENINGHCPFGNLRGEKYSLYEGGTRVPFVCTWPGHIKGGWVQEQPFNYMDLMATLPALVGEPLDEADCRDSRDASRLFVKRHARPYRDCVVMQDNGGQLCAVMGRWKLIPARGKHVVELYDLKKDPSETTNVAEQYPKVVRKMTAMVEQLK